jgi:hypothetical protein
MLKRITVLLIALLGASGPLMPGGQRTCCGPCVEHACIPLPEPKIGESLSNSSSDVFLGTVIAQELAACCDERADVTFKVLRRWRGAETPTFRIRTPSCTDHSSLVLGRTYLVSAIPVKDEPPGPTPCFWPIEEDAARPVMAQLDNLHAGTSDR